MLRGVKLAVAGINAAGGVNGHKVKILELDDQANPALAASMVTAAKKARAVGVIGPYNSSVGIINLPQYIAAGITPVQLTSTDQTTGMGVTIQPKNSQISPVEVAYITGLGVKKVAMLVDPSDYTQGMADRTSAALKAAGITVTSTPIVEGQTNYSAPVATALASGPDLVYVSTYFPEGSKIANALAAANTTSKCLMGLANVDPAFVTAAGIANSQRCKFSGVPEAGQLDSAKRYVAAYKKAYKVEPGVWGVFTFDSTKMLAKAIRRAGSKKITPVLAKLKSVKNYEGQSGLITMDPKTGNRVNVPVFILTVDSSGTFTVS